MPRLTKELNNFRVELNELQEVFHYKDNECVGLNKEKYGDNVCGNFFQQFGKTVNIKWGNDKGKSITIDLYCAAKDCEVKYKLTQKKSEIKFDHHVNLIVKSTEQECEHKNEKLIRQLKGDKRKKIGGAVKDKSVEIVRTAAIISSNKEALAEGHLQEVYTKSVMRKAASELRVKNDKSIDPMYDIFLQANELKYVHNIEYKHDRFNITLISSEQVEILKKYISMCKKDSKVPTIHYDASGGMLAKPCEGMKSLFHHVIVIPMKMNPNDDQGSFINIGEMISSVHTSDQQEIFIRRFLQLAMKQISSEGKD